MLIGQRVGQSISRILNYYKSREREKLYVRIHEDHYERKAERQDDRKGLRPIAERLAKRNVSSWNWGAALAT
jgi:hypothetical protein